MQHSQQFVGRQFAVTGGCSGIGLAVSKTLLILGATVYIADIFPSAPADLTSEKNCHITLNCDITSREACKSFLDDIPGRLDGLVNSAGIARWEGYIASDDLFHQTMSINVTGTWNMTTEAMARMSSQDDLEVPGTVPGSVRSVGQGSIVNVGSGASLRGVSGLAAYTASKHAVLGLTRSWARDFPNLRVNLVAPGATDTPMVKSSLPDGSENLSNAANGTAQIAFIPKGRMAHATDVADAIVFFLSDESSFVTGQCLPVNGGNF
ncbi:SDR family NAD(P)-dependent oxidoreductase [Aspergillus stella-maris]|uniref:SDR family NAD(P)-dependent oxidoreductase n=1 Tax=Aspergillus stella-maris TaxID=1810926 RepID=UPI003CCDF37D